VTVLEAMKVGGFSDAEIYDRAKQAWIYCRWKKSPAGTKNDKPHQPNVVVVNRSAENEESLSSVTGTLTSGTSTLSESVTKKAKRVRMTGADTQSSRNAREEDKKLYNHAFKWATITYAQEKQKKGGLSAKGLTELIKNEFKVELCTRSVQKYVKNGCIGVSPQRRGPKGKIDELHYKNLCLAFESFVVINQNNGDARIRTYKKLGKLLQKVVYGDSACHVGQQAHHLLQRVLNAGKTKNAEDRWVRWTNHKNILMWFDNWEHDLVELGFARVDAITKKVTILPEQLRNMGNLDETNISLVVDLW